MKRKDIGLFLSVSILALMAVFSEKKVLVTTGYAVSRDELDAGREIYFNNCRRCHGRGRGGAPRTGDVRAWKPRLEDGMESLIAHAVAGHRGRLGTMPPQGGNPELDEQEMAAAVAYMVRESEER